MRLPEKINKPLLVVVLLLIVLIIFVANAVREEVKVAFFFTAVYVATLGYLVVDRFNQTRKQTEFRQTSFTEILDSLKAKVNPPRVPRKITKKLVIRILLPLSFIISAMANDAGGRGGDELVATSVVATFLAFGCFLVDRVVQRRKRRKLEQASLKTSPESSKARTRPSRLRNKINRKLLIGIFLLLALVIIIIAASTSNDGETVFGVIFGFASIGTLLFLVVDRFIQKRKVRQLKEASLRAEVDSLKTQINPHFFFNTLNNLYGLSVEKSDMAPEVILKLSDMMRYTIYEGEKDRVALEEEITYLESYIELQKIRFHRELDVKFEHFIEEVDIKVPPLLFIVLVENAFKHGAESLTGDAFIHLKLMSMNGSVLFETQNNFEADEGATKSGGIGLKNLQRRLQLLFPDEHTLLIDGTSNGIYKATLKFKVS